MSREYIASRAAEFVSLSAKIDEELWDLAGKHPELFKLKFKEDDAIVVKSHEGVLEFKKIDSFHYPVLLNEDNRSLSSAGKSLRMQQKIGDSTLTIYCLVQPINARVNYYVETQDLVFLDKEHYSFGLNLCSNQDVYWVRGKSPTGRTVDKAFDSMLDLRATLTEMNKNGLNFIPKAAPAEVAVEKVSMSIEEVELEWDI